jgi:hypothetical protein
MTMLTMTKVALQRVLRQLLLLLPAALGKWRNDPSDTCLVSDGPTCNICFLPLALLELEVQEHDHANTVQVVYLSLA